MPSASGYPISPAELMKDYLDKHVDAAVIVPENIAVGPVNKEMIDAGCIELVDAGMPKQEPPGLVWVRSAIRCIGPTLDRVDVIGRHIWSICSNKNRVTASMYNPDGSVRDTYLIHVMKVVAGPSHHFDSEITWESLQFTEMMVGTTALASA